MSKKETELSPREEGLLKQYVSANADVYRKKMELDEYCLTEFSTNCERELEEYRFAIIEFYRIKSEILDLIIESGNIKEAMKSAIESAMSV